MVPSTGIPVGVKKMYVFVVELKSLCEDRKLNELIPLNTCVTTFTSTSFVISMHVTRENFSPFTRNAWFRWRLSLRFWIERSRKKDCVSFRKPLCSSSWRRCSWTRNRNRMYGFFILASKLTICNIFSHLRNSYSRLSSLFSLKRKSYQNLWRRKRRKKPNPKRWTHQGTKEQIRSLNLQPLTT